MNRLQVKGSRTWPDPAGQPTLTPSMAIQSRSFARVPRNLGNRQSMKKASRKPSDELRREYKRSDFTSLIRGKHTARVFQATNVVVLDPLITRFNIKRNSRETKFMA